MSITVIPNSGILGDDRLDKLRGDAILAQHETLLPDAVVHYLRALERELLAIQAERKRRSAEEIGWILKPADDEP